MLRIPAILLIWLLCHVQISAQSYITGKVVRAENGEPVPGSSVFLSNTSKGTVSDAEGNFELRSIPPGQYDLVVSSVGYETNVYSFNSSQLPMKLRVEMQVKVRELENVMVEPFVEEGWDRWGLTFTDYFLGATPNAADCRIRNRNSIKFRFFRKSNRLIAYCDEPLDIENRALGYRIKYQLEDFELQFRGNTSRYMGYVLFEDMDAGKKEVRKRWQRARDKAFYGSMAHFWRSVYHNRLKEEGFEVRRMWRTPNLERERVKQILEASRVRNMSDGGNLVMSMGTAYTTDSTLTDSSSYYQAIMRQKDYIEHFGKDLLIADSITHSASAGYKNVYFPDYLVVIYKNEKEDPAYLSYFRENRLPYYQQSQIWLTEPAMLIIFPDGSYYPPQLVFSAAYWAWSDKIADMLPLEFEPYDKVQPLKN